MSKKITFIGAGSFQFTRVLVQNILSFDAFKDAEISLMDIHPERLALIKKAVEKIIAHFHYPATVTATQDRKKALEGSDGVVITILSGSVNIWRHDIEIPKKYGVDINVGDTRGPSGIFRAMRTIPDMVDIVNDIETYCPDAVVLNYTNPMAMVCRAVQEVKPKIKFTGLCHSVQGTAGMLAGWINAPLDEITYLCAGINHQAWYLEYKWNGKDAYPLIKEAVKKPEIYNEEIVRNEMFLHLDYYVTESSGHNSEYDAWFRKRPELIEKYCTHGTGWNPGVYAFILDEYLGMEKTWKKEIEEWFLKENLEDVGQHEYTASIFNAVIGDGTLFEFNGNIRNFGLIDNLPEGCCVEVPVIAGKRGLAPVHVGPLPAHLAILNNISARIEDLAVEGILTLDKRKIFHAICHDPLTSAVLSLEEIKNMTDELFDKNKEYLGDYK